MDEKITKIAATEIEIDGEIATADLIIENAEGRWYAVDLGGGDWDYLQDNGEYIPVASDAPKPGGRFYVFGPFYEEPTSEEARHIWQVCHPDVGWVSSVTDGDTAHKLRDQLNEL